MAVKVMHIMPLEVEVGDVVLRFVNLNISGPWTISDISDRIWYTSGSDKLCLCYFSDEYVLEVERKVVVVAARVPCVKCGRLLHPALAAPGFSHDC